jgi:hypothetical protein
MPFPVRVCLIVCWSLNYGLSRVLIFIGMAKASADCVGEAHGGFASDGSDISGFSHMVFLSLISMSLAILLTSKSARLWNRWSKFPFRIRETLIIPCRQYRLGTSLSSHSIASKTTSRTANLPNRSAVYHGQGMMLLPDILTSPSPTRFAVRQR